MLAVGVGGVVWGDALHLAVGNVGVALALEVSGQSIGNRSEHWGYYICCWKADNELPRRDGDNEHNSLLRNHVLCLSFHC
jgi:hypothetical protein